jgi:ribosomal protein S18 acetylase RimI-like enzyme
MEPLVRPLRAEELRIASRLLAGAFADDPFIAYFFCDRRRRELAFPRFFRAVLHELAGADALFAVEMGGELTGVAAWAPPEVAAIGRRARWLARLASLELRALFPRAAPQLQAGFAQLAESHPLGPHWYLAFVGIDPRQHRRGLGRTLLRPVLARAEDAGIACYLETPFPDTRAFYRRLGFEDTDELRPVPGAPPIWTMTRPPKTSQG